MHKQQKPEKSKQTLKEPSEIKDRSKPLKPKVKISFFNEKKLARIEKRLELYESMLADPTLYDLLIMPFKPTENTKFTSSNSAFVLIQSKPATTPTALYFVDAIEETPTIALITACPEILSAFTRALYPKISNQIYRSIINLSTEQFQLATSISGHSHPGNENTLLTYEFLLQLEGAEILKPRKC